ncbi:MAG: biotin--[acetyl-CoA-carboxylase] ligase [Deltaproteobacteria bacterium]|nr:biotin--[acetyl-CoA-carboxylase] ligase [Deltaproteobacteria bacterium]
MDTADLLAAISDGGANGSSLAERFGVSRTMVWKRMQQLRAEGVVIEGAAGEGYTLVDPAGFGPWTLGWRCKRQIQFFEVCGSTNVEARKLAESSSSPEGLLVVANQQDAGRGRLGRAWNTEAGHNLLFSVVLKPQVVPQLAPVCVLAWAAAMAEVLDCQVKWPNDLVTPEGHKIGGILAELASEAEQVRFVVLGVGINVNQTSFPDLPQATSLSILRGQPLDRAELLGRLVAAIESVPTQGAPSLGLWRSRSHTLGRTVRVGDVEGLASDVRDDGALLVGGHAVLAGDVEMVAS